MNRNLCIGLAEKIVAAKNDIEQKTGTLRQKKKALKAKSLFIGSDRQLRSDEFMMSMSPYWHPKMDWEKLFEVTPEILDTLKELLIAPYEKALEEAQAKLDMLLEGDD
jgi:hypothetical protein